MHGCSAASHPNPSKRPPPCLQVLNEYYDSVEGEVSMDASVEHAGGGGGATAGSAGEAGTSAAGAAAAAAAAAPAMTPAPVDNVSAGGTADAEIVPEAAAAAGGSGGSGEAAGEGGAA